ncbi:MAG: hypothetical protein WBA74_12235, partial [Cyclobacteriaceae bacterium]
PKVTREMVDAGDFINIQLIGYTSNTLRIKPYDLDKKDRLKNYGADKTTEDQIILKSGSEEDNYAISLKAFKDVEGTKHTQYGWEVIEVNNNYLKNYLQGVPEGKVISMEFKKE